MRKIYKYVLEPTKSVQTISIPGDAEFLTVQNKNEELVLWALVFPNEPEVNLKPVNCLSCRKYAYAVIDKLLFASMYRKYGEFEWTKIPK